MAPVFPVVHRIRLATPADLPALRALIPLSVRALSQGFYTPAQIESAIRYVFGPDTQLVADGTYFVVESPASASASLSPVLVGCGGWSRRRTLYGGDQLKAAVPDPHATSDELLDAAAEPARVRAFFVHPDHARQGIGTLLLDACREAARAAGFTHLQLAATLPGVPLYERWGFQPDHRLETTLPDGTPIAFVQMSYTLEASPPAAPL